MSDLVLDQPISGSAKTPTDWLGEMERLTVEDGYIEPLGKKHWAFFVDDSPTLLVTFDTVANLEASADGLPLAYAMAKEKGWSLLCLISDGETWYRDRAVYGYMDRLVDDAFFEDFDQVLFYGAGVGGYAAAVFSVAAPGANVLAIAPRATMDPAIAGWDGRHRAARRLNFGDRYGYAPLMTEGAGQVWIIHDPLNAPDAMHAALFSGSNVTVLAARHTGGQTERVLLDMKAMPQLLVAGMAGTLTPLDFAKIWRGRRTFSPYLRTVLQATQDAGRKHREIKVLRSITKRMHAPRLARRLAGLTAAPPETTPEAGVQ